MLTSPTFLSFNTIVTYPCRRRETETVLYARPDQRQVTGKTFPGVTLASDGREISF
ncbi:uncharacterized protein G2W53_042044 [Senna tora]|uniref:Uncharacterized protein n=1 Tax=Senna tora TaxID=362788 RepID=A0A834SIF7_9FABA|nr:uncharacterized protein G2W53_042044 [Senna tora]